MSNIEVLRKIIHDYPNALDDRKKLQALFMDFFPEDKLLRNTLLMAYDEGITSEMESKKQMDNIAFHHYVSLLEQGYGVAVSRAETVVKLWAEAFDVVNVVLTENNNYGSDDDDDDVMALIESGEYYKNTDSSEYTNILLIHKKPSEDIVMVENLDDYEYIEDSQGVTISRFIGFDEPKIILPNTYKGKKIYAVGTEAFKGCTGIEKIIVPEGIEVLGTETFRDCKGLQEIQLPSTLKEIGRNIINIIKSKSHPIFNYSYCGRTFLGCSSLKAINIPNNVEFIGDSCFNGCSSLTFIKLPNSVKHIGRDCFYGCSSLTSIRLPKELTDINKCTFGHCSKLEKIIFPTKLNSIKEEAFSGCKNLQELILPYGLRTIEKLCFEDCGNLKSIYIPKTVTEIAERLFISNLDFRNTIYKDKVTVYCEAGSYAQQYARNMGMKCAKAQNIYN